MTRTNCFSAAPCSFDLQTTVSCYNFKLDKNLIHAGLRTGLCGRDLIHESQYTLLHFSSQQRNNFLYFCSTIVNIVFSFINISTLHAVVTTGIKMLKLKQVLKRSNLFFRRSVGLEGKMNDERMISQTPMVHKLDEVSSW